MFGSFFRKTKTTRLTVSRTDKPKAIFKISDDPEDQIRDRAYFLWKKAGCPDGQDLEFWLKAEYEYNGDMIGIAKGLLESR